MKRNCAICGKQLDITVNEKTSDYAGGHYFGSIGEIPEVSAEYWECDACYKEWPKE